MKWIITSTLCASFLVNSIMFGWEATRRTADDVAKINTSQRIVVDSSSKEQACIDGGGMPDYYDGKFSDCKKNN